MDRDKKIMIAVLGGAGILGLYFVLRKKPAFVGPVVPMAQPSLLDTLVQGLTNVAVATVNRAPSGMTKDATGNPISATPPASGSAIARARARGDAHYMAFSAAFRLERPTYLFGGKCFRTSDAMEVAATQCAATQLEGIYWERG